MQKKSINFGMNISSIDNYWFILKYIHSWYYIYTVYNILVELTWMHTSLAGYMPWSWILGKYFLVILKSIEIQGFFKACGKHVCYLYCKSRWHVSVYDGMYILCLLEFQEPMNTIMNFCYYNPCFISVCTVKFKWLKSIDS